MALKELDPKIYKNKVENPGETVYEIIAAEDDVGFGLAIADIEKSQLHIHREMTEDYLVRNGTLEVILNGKRHVLREGESITIPPDTEHEARSLEQDPGRIIVISYPAWTPEDHHLIK